MYTRLSEVHVLAHQCHPILLGFVPVLRRRCGCTRILGNVDPSLSAVRVPRGQRSIRCTDATCASRASSCLELQLGALAQTTSLAPGSAKDHFQDGTYHIQREILQAAFLSPQSPGPHSRNLKSEGQHLLRIPLRRSAAAGRLFRCANRLKQSQFENSRSRLTRVIQDTSKDRTVYFGLPVIHLFIHPFPLVIFRVLDTNKSKYSIIFIHNPEEKPL